MFKFGFSGDEEETVTESLEESDTESCKSEKVILSEEVFNGIKKISENHVLSLDVNQLVNLKYISPNLVLKELRENEGTKLTSSILEASNQESDLIPGKYEGGLKIWECTHDLLNYLVERTEITFKEMEVLDLGCGSGLLGILALLHGASVTFQDYNSEILESITMRNVILNLDRKSLKDYSNISFYSGDWGSFLQLLEESSSGQQSENLKNYKQFDIILTSETIYNIKNYHKIYDIIKNCLRKNGVAYIAAKSYYFGVGGSVSEFEEFIKKDNSFKVEYSWKNAAGLLREIIKVTHL